MFDSSKEIEIVLKHLNQMVQKEQISGQHTNSLQSIRFLFFFFFSLSAGFFRCFHFSIFFFFFFFFCCSFLLISPSLSSSPILVARPEHYGARLTLIHWPSLTQQAMFSNTFSNLYIFVASFSPLLSLGRRNIYWIWLVGSLIVLERERVRKEEVYFEEQ